ncbi:hypothetical protein [Pseudomonas sp. RL_105y_Pfl2_101]|uniref:hypothetical protein n=1 Tax=Pseudomonas sp. RL_105y_Pfl2_101 TaxID=3088708 RepID=UPI0030D81887
MERKTLECAFNGIWARFKNSNQDKVNLEEIESWAVAKGLTVSGVVRRDVGRFGKTDCVIIHTEHGSACFPVTTEASREDWIKRDESYSKTAAIWEKLEWFSPFWVCREDVTKILNDCEHRTAEDAIKLFNYHTSTIYTLSFEAVCIEQIMVGASCLADIRPLAREAYLAFYAGYKSASIAALIPAIEGAVSKILPMETQSLATMERVNKAVAGAISNAAELHFEGMWTPTNYKTTEYLFGMDEMVFAFETFRRWLQDSFYKNTDGYKGAARLNRHLFAHGLSPEWQQANLSRLIVAISTVSVIESWYHQDNSAPLLFPATNKDSELLWQQAILHGSAQMVIKLMEEKHYQENGKLVPIVPTDDGATLRKALLMKDCIDDLVRPLRSAGWAVEFTDDSSDLYVKVSAQSKEGVLNVALLYSCASDNSLYKELEKDCNAILYRGAPYLQEQFARGVKVHVGPVAGWQPPLAINYGKKGPGGDSL